MKTSRHNDRRSNTPLHPETARVIAGHGRHYFIQTPSDEIFEAHRRGKKGDVVVGDIVHFTEPVSNIVAIEKIDPRRNLLYRSDEWRIKSLAANIDQVAVVFASRPSFNAWFIWKALLAAHQANIPALVIRNKKDLSEEADRANDAVNLLRSFGTNVVEVSATEAPEETKTTLLPYLSNKATLFVGQSGMGKSSILNVLIPSAQARTREFSEALNLGKQTTTTARWYRAHQDEWNGHIIDSPGFQEFGLAHLSLNDILRAMPDIAQHVRHCRFFNCRHLQEPGCGVKAAVEAGLIHPDRYEFYAALAAFADTKPL